MNYDIIWQRYGVTMPIFGHRYGEHENYFQLRILIKFIFVRFVLLPDIDLLG